MVLREAIQKKIGVKKRLDTVFGTIQIIRYAKRRFWQKQTEQVPKEREDKILEMESNKDSLKARISTTTNHVTNLEHTIESIRSEFKAQESKIKGKRAEQAQINREIKAMKSSGADRYVLKVNMLKILRQIFWERLHLWVRTVLYSETLSRKFDLKSLFHL